MYSELGGSRMIKGSTRAWGRRRTVCDNYMGLSRPAVSTGSKQGILNGMKALLMTASRHSKERESRECVERGG